MAQSFTQRLVELFMTAPQVSVRGARVPSDMCHSTRASKSANWANAHQFPAVSPNLSSGESSFGFVSD
ncbi:hypothetical protein THRCLA_21410 [Thraustotheca clavata]|uniref:Uncharacterized protein n=1 Tax=Thraustotheca clavata TaxID=74557 RepID=A0A1V9ZWU3_9STRA|nr:hypothetical protein THRCLA_21410 [Thraustotheca clavata]